MGVAAFSSRDHSSQSKLLLWLKYTHNMLPLSLTGLFPFQCMHGQQPLLFLDTEPEVNIPSAPADCPSLSPDVFQSQADTHQVVCSPQEGYRQERPSCTCLPPTGGDFQGQGVLCVCLFGSICVFHFILKSSRVLFPMSSELIRVPLHAQKRG